MPFYNAIAFNMFSFGSKILYMLFHLTFNIYTCLFSILAPISSHEMKP